MKPMMSTSPYEITLPNRRKDDDLLAWIGKLKTITAKLEQSVQNQQTLRNDIRQTEESLLGLLEQVRPTPPAKFQPVYCQYSGFSKCLERFWPKDRYERTQLEREGWVCDEHKESSKEPSN